MDNTEREARIMEILSMECDGDHIEKDIPIYSLNEIVAAFMVVAKGLGIDMDHPIAKSIVEAYVAPALQILYHRERRDALNTFLEDDPQLREAVKSAAGGAN